MRVTAGRGVFDGFNPRPTLMPGDSNQREQLFGNHVFQSTPDINAGRLDTDTGFPAGSSLFQSTPDINAGRLGGYPHAAFVVLCFNPRPTLMPGDSPLCRGQPQKVYPFQSTPDINAGRLFDRQTLAAWALVSIHARH